MNDYAKVDNMLSASQTDIGESSNLAQIAQTYSYTFDDEKYDDYVSQLSVIAQAAIDNSKRRFDIDISEEIKRIKDDMDIKENKYPEFWRIIKIGFNSKNINKELHCPMNYLCNLKFENYRDNQSTLPMSYYFNKYELDVNRRTSKKVEDFINDYSLSIYSNMIHNEGNYLLLRHDYNQLIEDIKSINISKNYLGLMSWLVDRAFLIGTKTKSNYKKMETTIQKNKSLMIKVLYDLNKNNLFKIFSKNTQNC